MMCSVKDIIALKQKGNNTLKLYYSSKEFPEGQQVAKLIIGGEATTALKYAISVEVLRSLVAL